MKNECNIIRDLLPLYAEKMVSLDTAAFVEEHLKDCAACQKELEQLREPQKTPERTDAAPLVKLQKKMRVKKIQTIALTAVFVIALLASAFAVLDAPEYLPYSDGLVTVEALGDKGMQLRFDESVTGFSCTVYPDPDRGGFYCCEIQAWSSLWDRWFSRGRAQRTTTVTPQGAKPILAYYVPNNGSESICIAKYDPNGENKVEKFEEDTTSIVLPRLALGWYFIGAGAALAVLALVWLCLGKKPAQRVWIERLGLYPVAYMISHGIVSGFHTTSYSMTRDFCMILLLSILLYSAFLLAYNIWRLNREIREINK